MNVNAVFGEQFPEYQEGMLVVKVRSAARGLMPLVEPPAGGEWYSASPGWEALSFLDRAGLVKGVTPVIGPTEEEESTWAADGPLMALASRRGIDDAEDPSAGVNVIELVRDEDVARLQTAMASDSNVEYASRVPLRHLVAEPPGIAATPPPAKQMWNLKKIQWSDARKLKGFKEANEIKVAVLDTGIDSEHPDLQDQIDSYWYPEVGSSPSRDIVGHGTHVAGTVAALINNALGINGICDCELHVYKIFSDNLWYNPARHKFSYVVDSVAYYKALGDCLKTDIDVINLSIGGTGKPDNFERELFNRLVSKGTTVVAAMGNGRKFGSPKSYPAAIPGVIAVGATNVDDTYTVFSTAGRHISLCAPGAGIWSTLPTYPGQFGFFAVAGPNNKPVPGPADPRETDYDAWPGTSMASPHVAAAAALLLANKGPMSGALVRERLKATADKVPGMGGADFDSDYGSGRLNLLRLLKE